MGLQGKWSRGDLRDEMANCIMAVGEFESYRSLLEAKINIVISLLQIYVQQHIKSIQVQSSSALMVKMGREQGCHWTLANSRRQLQSLLQCTQGQVHYFLLECNSVTKYLAKKACALRANFRMSNSYLDNQFQALLILDLVCPHVSPVSLKQT